MSWFYCTSASQLPNIRVKYSAVRELETRFWHIIINGNEGTYQHYEHPDRQSGWLVVGTAIDSTGSDKRVFTMRDWMARIQNDTIDVSDIDGHFTVVRWQQDELYCCCDQLGVGTMYFAQANNHVHCSNRLDYLSQQTGLCEPDFTALGSRWLLHYGLGYESGVHNVQRLGPSGYLRATTECALQSCHYVPWSPRNASADPSQAESCLHNLMHTVRGDAPQIKLALTGGLDSRMLLATLLGNYPGTNIQTFTVGDCLDPDCILASRVAKQVGAGHRHIEPSDNNASQTAHWLQEFAATSHLSESIESAHKLDYAQFLPPEIHSVINGRFGEIARRRYHLRIAHSAKSAWNNRDSATLRRYLRSDRAQFLSPEVLAVMEQGTEHALERALNELPETESIGIENSIDLFVVRNRLPNLESQSQLRSDAQFVSYMPMAQPSFLNHVFAMDLRHRKNARWFVETIRSRNSGLRSLPLECCGHTYSLGGGYALAAAKLRMRRTFLRAFRDPWPDTILHSMKNLVLDCALSMSVRQCAFYDGKMILREAEAYFNGSAQNRDLVARWISFEWWRQSLSGDVQLA